MNWYKKSQTIQELQQQYSNLGTQGVNITGSGQGETVQIPGGKSIIVGDLLRQALNSIQHILVQNGVKEINTDPIYQNLNAQGLAISHEPGRIRIDVKRIVEQAKGSLPAISQLDGVEIDPDVSQNIVDEVSNYILSELGETMAHESFHSQQYRDSLSNQNQFIAEEQPAQQFGQQIRQQYFGV